MREEDIKRFVETGVLRPYRLFKNTTISNEIRGCPLPRTFQRTIETSLMRTLMVAPRPVVFCLSGGLDSTTLVKLGERFGPVETISTVFPGTDVDELEYVDAAIDSNVAVSTKIVLGPPTLNDIEKLIKLHSGPIAGLSIYVQYCLMEEAAKQGYKTVIDGQGPDELLCGYIAYQAIYVKTLWKRRERLLALRELYYSLKLHPRFWWNALKLKFYGGTKHYESTTNEMLDEVMYEDLTTDSIPAELETLRVNAAVFGITVYSPYLEHDVVEYLASLALDQKIRDGQSKWIMREAGKKYLPDSIRKRFTKLGFPAPEAQWMKDELRDLVLSVLNSESFANRPYWNANEIRTMYNKFVQGKRPYDRKLWRVVCTELWLRSQ